MRYTCEVARAYPDRASWNSDYEYLWFMRMWRDGLVWAVIDNEAKHSHHRVVCYGLEPKARMIIETLNRNDQHNAHAS